MNYVENLLIYARNLSPFYIFSMVISICVVLLTAYLGFTGCTATLDQDERNEVLQQNKSSNNKTERQKKPTQTTNDSDRSEDSSEDSKNVSEQEQESEDEATRQLHIESLGQLKSAKLKSIEKSLTDEQRQAEKEIERAQLAAIFELLKKQADSSNLNEDDLKEQLSLYR
ncbi:ABC transporter F family member 4 [Anopheles stephensi]|uniref:ABC transporter F family member 4 n=1 Tax=Anopheles stephensi TaxID=30069 RepID=UPI001658BD27|nr:ABC transporter F family member 4 [Anopheles stephensi]